MKLRNFFANVLYETKRAWNIIPPSTYEDREGHHKFALSHGFFWVPCPICGKNYGGHEWKTEENRYRNSLMSSAFSGSGICPNCIDEAERRNLLRLEEFREQEENAMMSLLGMNP